MADFAHLQGLTTIPRDPHTRAPLTTLGSRYKILNAAQMLQVDQQYKESKAKITLAKTTHADKQRQLRARGIMPPKNVNKHIYGGGGEKTYDVGVVARAKERAGTAALQHQHRFLSEAEELEIVALQQTLGANDKALAKLRRKINRLTNGKTALKQKKKSKQLFSEKTGGSNPQSNASSRSSLASSNSTKSFRSHVQLAPLGGNDENNINGHDSTANGGDEADDMFEGLSDEMGDQQLPDNILKMVDHAQQWTDERKATHQQRQAPTEGSIREGAKVEVFCALGTYMGRKKTNFVKDGVVFKYQTGKVVKRTIKSMKQRKNKIVEQEYSPHDGQEYYTIKYLDNDIEYDVKQTRINAIETNSQKQTLLYLKQREEQRKNDSKFKPFVAHEIPEAVLDTSLYSRLVEDEQKRREDVRATRHELLLSMERPFEGLQERTNEQMARKKNRLKEFHAKRELKQREKKAKEKLHKDKAFEKAKRDIEIAKQVEQQQLEKKRTRQEKHKVMVGEGNERRQQAIAQRNLDEETAINERFPFKPQIPIGDIDKVLQQPDNYEDLKTSQMKASVNAARRALYRASAARSKANDLMKRELRSSSHTSLAKAVLEKSTGGGTDDGTGSKDPSGVNLSLLTNYRKDLKKAKKFERECQQKVDKIEKKAAKAGKCQVARQLWVGLGWWVLAMTNRIWFVLVWLMFNRHCLGCVGRCPSLVGWPTHNEFHDRGIQRRRTTKKTKWH